MAHLENLVAAALKHPVPPEISAMANHVRGLHAGVVVVLAYGSCLRGVATTQSLIDLYVLTAGLKGVSPNPLSRWACALVPPNVYYAECEFDGQRYRAKYAVLPLTLFARWMTAGNPYFWARFSQPASLLFATDEQATIAAITQAVRTMYGYALGLALVDPWAAGFTATYATELRAETSTSRAASLVAANADYYTRAASLMAGVAPIKANWRCRRITGKLWSIARLAKAAFTFTGGADYIVWKIERHSGEKIELSDWQRRHPVVIGLILLPRLLKRGAVR